MVTWCSQPHNSPLESGIVQILQGNRPSSHWSRSDRHLPEWGISYLWWILENIGTGWRWCGQNEKPSPSVLWMMLLEVHLHQKCSKGSLCQQRSYLPSQTLIPCHPAPSSSISITDCTNRDTIRKIETRGEGSNKRREVFNVQCQRKPIRKATEVIAGTWRARKQNRGASTMELWGFNCHRSFQ